MLEEAEKQIESAQEAAVVEADNKDKETTKDKEPKDSKDTKGAAENKDDEDDLMEWEGSFQNWDDFEEEEKRSR